MARAEAKEIPVFTRTARAFLQETDGVRLPIGDVSITSTNENPSASEFAEQAFKMGRASLQKLMPHRYSVVIVRDGASDESFGLDRWVTLIDRKKEQLEREQGFGRKLPIRRAK